MVSRNIVIIGGGPGGYVAAIKAAQLGGKVTLIEKEEIGGTCLNRGCIPTKVLLQGAELMESLKKGKDFGIQSDAVTVDFAKLSSRKNRAVLAMVSGVAGLLKSNGIKVIKGKGRLISPDEIQVDDGTGGITLQAGKIIIATGSIPAKLPVSGTQLPNVIDSSRALEMTRIPGSMVVIGAGAIGLEFGTIFAALGAKVTILELRPKILPTEDDELTSALDRLLKRRKVQIMTEAQVTEITEAEDKLTLKALIGKKEMEFKVEMILAAVGREANVEDLGLDEAGIRYNENGIEVNSRMETNVPGIYAVGDVTGQWLLAHFAFAQGEVAAENAMGGEAELDDRVVPRCVYTLPQVASVGLTEKEARENGCAVRVGRFPFTANAKAAISGERNGFIKIIGDANNKKILGVHILGHNATDLIGEAVLAMNNGAIVEDLARAIHPHPTLTEVMKEAALDLDKLAIHIPPRR